MPNTPNFEVEAISEDSAINHSAVMQFLESNREKMIELFGEEKTEWFMNYIAESRKNEEKEQDLVFSDIDVSKLSNEDRSFIIAQKEWFTSEKKRIVALLSTIQQLNPEDANNPDVVELKEYLENDIKETDMLLSQGFWK